MLKMTGSLSRLPWVRILGWACLLASTGALVLAESRRSTRPEGVAIQDDLIYLEIDGRPLRLDVYWPEHRTAPGPIPGVIALHGGGWRGGGKGDVRHLAVPLARRGYAVFAVDYRLASPGAPSWPGNLADVREAVRWVRANRHRYNLDPDRIAALGVSAGGHLAALLGTDPEREGGKWAGPSARVAAVVDFYGPADLPALQRPDAPAHRAVDLLVGGTGPIHAALAAQASPVNHVSPDDPPMLLIHGTDDRLVPLKQSERLAAALAREGVAHHLLVVPNARHGFGFQAEGRDLLPAVLDFLAHPGRATPPTGESR